MRLENPQEYLALTFLIIYSPLLFVTLVSSNTNKIIYYTAKFDKIQYYLMKCCRKVC